MAANMQHMAGPGQMMQQQQQQMRQKPQLQQAVYQNIVQHTQTFPNVAWQAAVNSADRLGRTMNL